MTVQAAFCAPNPAAQSCFAPLGNGKYLADIYGLARQILQQAGVSRIYGGDFCTVKESDRFFSYRRDGQTGRMASAVWIER